MPMSRPTDTKVSMCSWEKIKERLLGKEKKDYRDVFYYLYPLKGPVVS